MSRRVSLPGADELFRTTGGMALQASSPRRAANGEARVPGPAGESDEAAAAASSAASTASSAAAATSGASVAEEGDGDAAPSAEHAATEAESDSGSRGRAAAAEAAEKSVRRSSGAAQEGSAGGGRNTAPARRRARAANRRPSGRERHDEKITVYVSAEELMDLEHARLVLRGEHGLAVDRGRIVREAVAVVLADLESRGDASILVRRLRGR
ncbi:hypothetical protein [Streptomyces sp. VRA16 Mangrove soil]|uniref:hypothetical protein n=1 Tax=Streptomyces sp. VRA16 Mangrove soil TaxID=2817434 RepID=UPI001A9EB63F|nr:hypothetical protein [Streptomyces sp. VRA16 Mangrove soil]MBO1332017.1 hypothetical protein [Streptomyces sp. VRA16 Mangrove soil]